MSLEALLIILIVGAVAGWLAGLIVRASALACSATSWSASSARFIAAWLLPRIGIVIGGGMIASIINATIGAVILLVIIGLIKRA